MRNIIKKLTLIIICISTIFSSLTAFAFNDVINTEIQNEIDVISDYGIMVGYEDGNFYPNKAVTRAEIVAVALRMKKLDSPVSKNATEQTYSDVPPSHWAYGVIEMASSLGIVSGYPDGTFQPNKMVTYQEAIKIFVSILGYDVAAQLKGGYPNGYIQIARNEKLISLSGITYTDNATRGAIAVMAYNALQSRIMVEAVYVNGVANYTVSESTLLDIYFNSNNSKGLVTATPIASLTGEKTAEGRISIDNVVYRCDADYNDLLGSNVKFFYKDNDGTLEIVSIVEEPSTQNKLVINAEELERFTGIYTVNGTMTYYTKKNSSKVKSVKLNPALSLIYNNDYIPYDNLGSVDLDVKMGTIELIDNNDDRIYDVVKILSYTDYYVNTLAVNGDKKYITDGSGTGLIYGIEDVYEKITYNGAKIEFTAIPKDSIVSAALNKDKSVVELVVSDYTVEGRVESQSYDDNNNLIIWIDGVEYVVSPSALSSYVNTALGSTGAFKLNFMRQVAHFIATGDDGECYGYLTYMLVEHDDYSTVKVKMLTADNKFVLLEVADKVRYYKQGVSSTITEEEFYNEFVRTPTSLDVRRAETQVVKYKLNADGQLNLIRTAATTPSTDEFSYAYINPTSGQAEGRRYYANKLFVQNYQITDETVCFDIPWTLAGEDYTRYTSGKANEYFSDGNYYQVLLFDADEENKIGAVMYTRYGQDLEFLYTVSPNSPVMIVEKTHVALNENTGEYNTVICGLVDGEYTSQIIDDDYYKTMDPASTKFGAVIQYDDNSAKVDAAYYEDEEPSLVASQTLCIDNVTPKSVWWNGGNTEITSAARKTTYGTVDRITGFTVSVHIPNYPYGAEINHRANYFLEESQSVVIVDSNEKKLKLGNFYDILPGDRIFIRQRYNRIKDVVIYR